MLLRTFSHRRLRLSRRHPAKLLFLSYQKVNSFSKERGLKFFSPASLVNLYNIVRLLPRSVIHFQIFRNDGLTAYLGAKLPNSPSPAHLHLWKYIREHLGWESIAVAISTILVNYLRKPTFSINLAEFSYATWLKHVIELSSFFSIVEFFKVLAIGL